MTQDPIIIVLFLIICLDSELLTNINCINNDNVHCYIGCSTINCHKEIINGSKSDLLTIFCDASCQKSQILCPTNGKCHIYCQIDDGCNDLRIHSNGLNSELSIHCTQHSCNNLTIISSNINSLNIDAIGSNCYVSNFFVSKLNQIQIRCMIFMNFSIGT